MDPRQLRTRRRLRETIYTLAAAKPIDEATMTEVARGAGVTRDTVYRHGASPVALLADFLGEELRAVGAAGADDGHLLAGVLAQRIGEVGRDPPRAHDAPAQRGCVGRVGDAAGGQGHRLRHRRDRRG